MRTNTLRMLAASAVVGAFGCGGPQSSVTTPTAEPTLDAPPSSDKIEKAPAVSDTDRVRVAEAFRMADQLADRIWPGWGKTPFAVLLVTADHEFLIRHPNPSSDFRPAADDATLGGKVWYRPRKYPTTFEATFPAVNGVSTVVIGQAENTASKTSARWVITVLHEHFHQFQVAQPGYYAAVDDLKLARGDTSGMWMLNFPFPYGKPEVKERFTAMSQALARALQARGKPEFADRVAAYTKARAEFRAVLQDDEYRYFAFQVWAEGIARYTECRLATLAAAEYTPGKEFQGLKDYTPFAEVARDLQRGVEKDLESAQLEKAQRTVVYSFGAAEGLLLDEANPGWREQYTAERFALDGRFAKVK